MKLTRVVAFFVLGAGLGMNVLDAKTLRSVDGPAEFPPASFKGNQYVDSNGCVFVRAGVDGSVTWIPRVARSRQQVCGAQPSLSGAEMAAAKTAPAPGPVMLPDPDPQARKSTGMFGVKPAPDDGPAAEPVQVAKVAPRPAPRLAPKIAVKATPAPLTLRKPMQTVASVTTPPRIGMAARPAPVQAVAPRRMIVPQTVQAPVAPRPVAVKPGARIAAAPMGAGCAGLSPYARASLAGARGVRCGPQGVAPTSGGYVPMQAAPAMRQAAQPGTQVITPRTRIAPKHVYAMQQQSADVGQVPSGYRRVWEDDRLNTKRAHQTLEGRAMMNQRWTTSVPRQLKPVAVGSSFNPGKVYAPSAGGSGNPYLTSSRGLPVRTGPQAEPPVSYAPRAVASSNGYVSSKSVRKAAPAAQPKAAAVKPNRAAPKPSMAPAGHRYVQVGAFASEAGARNAIARLHGAGLPVRKKTVTKGGQTLQVIVTGPYGSQAELGKALSRARSAGFGSAFTH